MYIEPFSHVWPRWHRKLLAQLCSNDCNWTCNRYIRYGNKTLLQLVFLPAKLISQAFSATVNSFLRRLELSTMIVEIDRRAQWSGNACGPEKQTETGRQHETHGGNCGYVAPIDNWHESRKHPSPTAKHVIFIVPRSTLPVHLAHKGKHLSDLVQIIKI